MLLCREHTYNIIISFKNKWVGEANEPDSSNRQDYVLSLPTLPPSHIYVFTWGHAILMYLLEPNLGVSIIVVQLRILSRVAYLKMDLARTY